MQPPELGVEMLTIAELVEKRDKAKADAQAVYAKAEADNKRDLTADEAKQVDAFIAEAKKLEKDIERREELDKLEAATTKDKQSRGRTTPAAHIERNNSLDMPDKDFEKYSLVRAVRMTLDGKQLDGIEGEVNQEIARIQGKSARSFFMPTDLRMPFARRERRDLDTSTGTGGVNTTVAFDRFIDLLRNRMVVQQAGAQVIGGLVGDFKIPRQSGGATAYWVTEGNAPTESNQTLDQVSLAVKCIGAYTDRTRKFFHQTSLDVEQMMRADLAKVIALGIDLAAINGSGASGQPTGIFQNSAITTQFFESAASYWDAVIAMETAVAANNADVGSLAYITNAQVRGLFKRTPKFGSGTESVIWDKDNTVNGYRAFATQQVSSTFSDEDEPSSGTTSGIIFGNFNDLIIGMWGALDILVDPYTGSAAGTVRVVAHQDVDVAVRHPESFVKANDLVTT